MLDYLREYGSVSFSDAPVNDVDLLILSQLSYMDFDGAVPGEPFSRALAHAVYADSPDASEARFAFQKKDDAALATLSASCARYAGIRFHAFSRQLDAQRECQFAALAALLDDRRLIAAFRGTDNTLAGWKEDFNMAFMDEVPAQKMALDWLARIAGDFPVLTLCGHSKGGNLALYAASLSPGEIQQRIDCAVSFDGPGLNARAARSEGFSRMEERMRVVMPRDSLVALLFEQPKDVRIADSRVFSLLQHYPYFWKTSGMDFLYIARQTAPCALLGDAVQGLLRRLSPDVLEQFVEAVYEIISSAEVHTFNELLSRWDRSAAVIAARLFRTDTETRRVFLRVLSAFLSSAAEALGVTGGGS